MQEELSERVEDYRRRRARMRADYDPSASLEFDFQGEREAEPTLGLDSRVADSPREAGDLEIVFEDSQPDEATGPEVDSLALDRREAEPGILDSAPVGSGDYALETGLPRRRPIEIILDSQPQAEEVEGVPASLGLSVAPIGRRFLGGMADALVLIVASSLFLLIFWRAGGRLSPQPLNMGIAAFIAIFLIMAYFGAFTALTSTTPGLRWFGIEVRSLDGTFPTARQAFWRAFGYVVSVSALMLGFVWALVDSDGLTWHDRMSDTFLADAESATFE